MQLILSTPPFRHLPSLRPSKRYRVVLVPKKTYLVFFFSFFEETFDLQPGKGEGDTRVEMISVREIPTLSALTMCFWQRFLKKHGVSEWPMSIYRHDIPGTDAQGTLTVTWMTYLTSSGVEQMHLSVYQISSNGQLKFLDR